MHHGMSPWLRSASTLGVKIGDAAVNLAVGVLFELGLSPSTSVQRSSTVFSTIEDVRQGFRMAFTGTGLGFFLSVPEPLQAVCPLRATAASNSSASASTAAGDGDDGLPVGAIVGIVIACVVGALGLVFASVVLYKLVRLRREYNRLMATGSVADGAAVIQPKGAVTAAKSPMQA